MIKRCQTCSTIIDSGIICEPCFEKHPNISDLKSIGIVNDFGSTITIPASKGTKYDNGKPDLTINPVEALEAMARAFMYGAKKYNRGNFKKGLEVNRTLAAALRHIHAFIAGEDLDPESGESHLGHALAAIAMTVYNLKHNPDMDDR